MEAGKQKGGMGAAVESTEEIRKWEEHMMDINKLIEKLASNKDKGLTAEAASDAFTKYGENALTDKSAVPWYIVFLHELTSLFNLLLVTAGILCLVAYGL